MNGTDFETNPLGTAARLKDLEQQLNHPEIEDFLLGVKTEAAHQRLRWPSEQDSGKTAADWFWLIGYLAGKALAAAMAGNAEKAKHHVITTAAALFNWHLAFMGKDTNMRPGIAAGAPEGQQT